MNRIGSALVTGAGIIAGGWLGASIAYETKRSATDAGMIIGALVGGMLTSAATSEPSKASTGVSGLVGSFQNPRFP